MDRRSFIKGALGLAALTVAGGALSEEKLDSTTERFQKAIDGGLIENETFYLDEPITIAISGVVIRNCTFVAKKPMEYMIYITNGYTTLDRCDFYTLGGGAVLFS